MALVVVAAALVGIHVTVITLDEALLSTSAIHYTGGLPGTIFDDPTARATSRLYPLVIMPLFEVFDGDVAVRLAKVANALLWASTAVPLYLLARPVTRSRWAAAGAALLGVATPWIVLTTAILSESLALPAFVWSVWCVLRAVRAPGWRADGLAVAVLLASLCVRIQLGALLAAYLVVAVVVVLAEGRGRVGLRAAGAAAARRFPVLAGILAFAGVAALVLLVLGRLGADLDRLTGSYATPDETRLLPTDGPRALFVEVVSLGVGVGVLPLVAALAWTGRALRSRAAAPEAWQLAVVATAAVTALFAATIAAQHGFIGPLTEERYFFYAVPLVWVGAFAALAGRPAVAARDLVGPAVGVVVLLGAVALPRGLERDSVLMAPAGAGANQLLAELLEAIRDAAGVSGLSSRDVLFVLGAAAAVALWRCWESRPRARRALLVAGPAAVQLGLVAYVLAATTGAAAGGVAQRTGGPPFQDLGWVDRAIGREPVQWLQSAPRRDPQFVADLQRDTAFFSTWIRTRVHVPETPALADAAPLDALRLFRPAVDEATGALDTAPVPTVQWVGSPFAQVDGERLAAVSGGELELVRPSPEGTRLLWRSTGLESDGALPPDGARIDLWPRGGQPATLVLTFISPRPVPGSEAPRDPARVTVRVGEARRVVEVPPGDDVRRAELPVCAPAATAELEASRAVEVPARGDFAGALVDVRLRPGARCPG